MTVAAPDSDCAGNGGGSARTTTTTTAATRAASNWRASRTHFADWNCVAVVVDGDDDGDVIVYASGPSRMQESAMQAERRRQSRSLSLLLLLLSSLSCATWRVCSGTRPGRAPRSTRG